MTSSSNVPSSSNGRANGNAKDPSPKNVDSRSPRLPWVTGLCACLAAYGAGRFCRSQLVATYPSSFSTAVPDPRAARASLPHPRIPLERMPHTVYTSKQFVQDPHAQSSSILAQPHTTGEAAADPVGVEVAPDGSLQALPREEEETLPEEPVVHKPAGQHLLIDMIHVDPALLSSQEWLAYIMIELIQSSGLTMLSYHCHDIVHSKNNSTNESSGLAMAGVSCVGVLLESHVSIRTWPAHQVMVMDLFTCGEGDLRPLIPTIQNLFSSSSSPILSNVTTVKKTNNSRPHDKEPHILQWAYKMRGYPYDDDFENDSSSDKSVVRNPESVDGEAWVIGSMDCELKHEVARLKTTFQEVKIYDLLHPRFRTYENYLRSLSNDGSYYAQHPELFRPDRIVYLDDVMQSRFYGDAAYHEALVHPSLLAHPNPRRVAIIGGGEGATLREVLKHKTVEQVVMVEIDKEMVQLSREYLKEWSDCSKIPGSTPSCFDNERAQVLYTDAVAWFLERYDDDDDQVQEKDKFDVIIMDALDPSSVVDFSDVLYKNRDFVAALYNALTESGILISQVGEDNTYTDAPDHFTSGGQSIMRFEELLEDEGFERIKHYSEAHANFLAPWAFMSIWKDISTSERWYGSQAQVDLAIRTRIYPTTDGSEPLRFFDGATMMSYQYPSRIDEEVFCRRVPKPSMCAEGHGINPDRKNAPISTFEVRPSKIPNAGRGIFFKESVPANTYIAVEESVHDIVVFPNQKRLLQKMGQVSGLSLLKPFEFYLFGYGFSSDFFGDASYSVDVSILTFMNHGCNGTFVMGEKMSVTEMTADPKTPPEDFEDSPFESAFSDPFVDRNIYLYMNGADRTLRDVEAGEELLDNYLRYLHADNWEWGINSYRRQCEGQAGVITDYEQSDAPLDPVI